MADPKEVKEIAEQVMKTLETANPAVLFHVADQLITRLSDGSKTQWMELTLLDESDDEDEGGATFECPHCFAQVSGSDLIMVDVDWRGNEDIRVNSHGDGSGTLDVEPGSDDYVDIALVCPKCDMPVAPDPNWRVDWT